VGAIGCSDGTNWHHKSAEKTVSKWGKAIRINGMRIGDYSPEKAGVGGSTPSLATTF
jgi:hypothetical protein